jgi:hypothetical protein
MATMDDKLNSDISRATHQAIVEYNFFSSDGISEDRKTQRLLYLFIKDLLPDTHRRVLMSKEKRDAVIFNTPAQTATTHTKTAHIETMSVNVKQVCMWFCILIIFDILLLLYRLIHFGTVQSHLVQLALLKSFLLWLLFPPLGVVSWLSIICVHVLIPLWSLDGIA